MTIQQTVSLDKTLFSEDAKALELLNDLAAVHTTFSPEQLMGYTECNLTDALYVLFLLYARGYADIIMNICSKKDPDFVVDRRNMDNGLPSLPYEYEGDDGFIVIDDLDDLFYTMDFDLKQGIRVQFEAAK
jgi:hypothetical protein